MQDMIDHVPIGTKTPSVVRYRLAHHLFCNVLDRNVLGCTRISAR
jgi:hypothetical protein